MFINIRKIGFCQNAITIAPPYTKSTQRGPGGVQTPHLNAVGTQTCTRLSAAYKKPAVRNKCGHG